MTDRMPLSERVKLWGALTAMWSACSVGMVAGPVALSMIFEGWPFVAFAAWCFAVICAVSWFQSGVPGAPRWFRKRGGAA